MDFVVDLDNHQAEMRIEDALPGLTEPYMTVYAIDFGDSATSFYQWGDGTDPDDGDPWTTGLMICPDDFDPTEETPAGGCNPGPMREDPGHRAFYRELFELGERWGRENQAWDWRSARMSPPSREGREAELRALFDRWGDGRPARIFTYAEAGW